MNDPNTILSMTKHAGYVWPSFIIAGVILAALVVATLRGLARARAELADAEASMNYRRGDDDEA